MDAGAVTPIPPRVRLDISNNGKSELSRVRLTVGDKVVFLTASEWCRLIANPGKIEE